MHGWLNISVVLIVWIGTVLVTTGDLRAEPDPVTQTGAIKTIHLDVFEQTIHKRTGILTGSYMEFVSDPEARFDVQSVQALPIDSHTNGNRESKSGDALQWRSVGKPRPNFGFQGGAHWLRFTVHNPYKRAREFYLEAKYPMLDDLRLYAPDGLLERRTGDRLPFAAREVDFRHMVFRITQPPTSERTYYFRVQTESSINATVILWEPRDFMEYSQRTTRVLSMFYAILAIMLLFNFLLYLSIRERSYLYFTAYLLAITLFLFTLDGLAFQHLWPGWPDWSNISLPLWMNLSYLSGLIFARHYLRTGRYAPLLDKVIIFEILLATILAAAVFGLSYTHSIIAATALATVVAMTIISATFAGILKGYRSAYYFGIAWTMVLAGIFLYSLKTFAVLPDTPWTNWSIHAGVVMQVVMLSLGLADRINVLRLDLKRRLVDLRAAGRSIRSSENKYEHLVESSGDIIFSLDSNGTFLTANRAIQAHLGLRPDVLIGTSFLRLLYRSPELEEIMPGADFQRELIVQEMKELISTGNSIVFKAEFTTQLGEPRQLEVRLERVTAGSYVSDQDSNKKPEDRAKGRSTSPGTETHFILGKAAMVLEDSIMRFVEAERQVHVIGNFLNIADLITERVCKNLEKFADSSSKLSIHICVREMIINAIEHGNLAVTYDEKTQATDRETYMDLLLSRQKDARYRDRKVTVIYSLNRNRVWYRIRDEGAGFNHRKLFAKNPNAPNSEGLAHGRGISMARNIFDIVRYNDAGNQVTMIKRFD